MSIAYSKTREQFPLSTKKVLKKTLAVTLVFSILILVVYSFAAVVMFLSSNGFSSSLILTTLVVFGILALIFIISYLYQKWYYDVYFYDLTPDYIVIRKGPITPREITIPYERVQDVYVDQDILDRLFGIYDVHLSSATISSGMEAHIDGVEKNAADGLRGTLLQTVNQKISNRFQPPPFQPAQQQNPSQG